MAFVTWLLFFMVSLVLITPELLRAWSQHAPTYETVLGYPIPLAQTLIKVTLFLGALTFMYVSARAVGDGEYRYKFLDPLIDDLELTLLARNRCLNNPADTTEADDQPGKVAASTAPIPQSARRPRRVLSINSRRSSIAIESLRGACARK